MSKIITGEIPRINYGVLESTIDTARGNEKKILDSGHRREFENGFVRDMAEGKGRMDLLPWTSIMEWSKHSEKGAIKYGERNIDKGCPISVLLDSALRHIAKYLAGWDDEDHLSSALWNVGWAKEMEVTRPDMQDIPNRLKLRKEEDGEE